MDSTATGPAVGVMLTRDIPAGQAVPYARRAEDLGFDEIWVVEDLGFRGGIAQAAAVLGATSRIRVGIGIVPVGARNPAFAAMEAATLGQLFPGRVDVGVGHGMPGWMRSIGEWPDSPLTLLREYLDAVRALLRGERLETAGRYIRLDGIELEDCARPDVVPDILAGVRGPKSLAVSGAAADGTILAEPVSPQYAREAVGHIGATRPHRLVAYNVASVGTDPAAALAAARPGLEWVGEPDWAAHIRVLPFAGELAALRADCATREEFGRRIPDAWIPQLAVAGTPAQARARIDELHGAGVTSAVLIPGGGDHLTALDSLARVL
ncbi:LLM class flavin-dependent oxidoreductase [Streptomyces sp. N2-109]|uniref:LLM class flavin-dependent oxidoreductase n=1 Tax=Streptomyces gossypii TaxID=2883101 RepID=A0ABT2JVR4_9ACTN|nr:LLM class flavin-dependent oxidoreductase [Streptomyces gossypii]MCT2591415.1 LLM class flavin-dependent oxidoreductase [Streptomyces gossypii]